MSERDTGGGSSAASARSLRAALRRARLSQAEHGEVLVDLRAAELTRLEVLADELEPVIDELPPETDVIDCTLVPGHPPRLWIDMLGYVVMARDKRTYQLISETRSGRQVLFESDDARETAGRVTDYIAHRLIERERLAAGARQPRLGESELPESHGVQDSPGESARRDGNAAFWQVAFAFALGLSAGIVAMLVTALVITR